MVVSKSFLVIFPVTYFSAISVAIGPAHRLPQYPFSTTTAMAIVGFSFGANATNIEWSFN